MGQSLGPDTPVSSDSVRTLSQKVVTWTATEEGACVLALVNITGQSVFTTHRHTYPHPLADRHR